MPLALMAALFEDLIMRRDESRVGDGELGRTLRDLQRKHFVPPDVSLDRYGGLKASDIAAQSRAHSSLRFQGHAGRRGGFG